MRALLPVAAAVVVFGFAQGAHGWQAPATAPAQQSSQAAPEKPPARATQRLYMRDGSFQVVSEYHLAGARVRFLSAERGTWEEVPTELVDLDKTQQWNREHAQLPPAKPAPKPKPEPAAATPDKPALKGGLELPDTGVLFATDAFRDTEELVPLRQEDATPAAPPPTKAEKKRKKQDSDFGDLGPPQEKQHLGIQPAALPARAEKATGRNDIRLKTTDAKIRIHIADPVFYVRSGNWVLVRVQPDVNRRDRALTPVTAETLQGRGKNALGFTATTLPGGKWIELKPHGSIPIGEYAMVQVLGPDSFDAHVWDFAVDPTAGENGDAILGDTK